MRNREVDLLKVGAAGSLEYSLLNVLVCSRVLLSRIREVLNRPSVDTIKLNRSNGSRQRDETGSKSQKVEDKMQVIGQLHGPLVEQHGTRRRTKEWVREPIWWPQCSTRHLMERPAKDDSTEMLVLVEGLGLDGATTATGEQHRHLHHGGVECRQSGLSQLGEEPDSGHSAITCPVPSCL
ncbi:hypothetical protein CC79DRAFT_684662 [Sarocladium strictum]